MNTLAICHHGRKTDCFSLGSGVFLVRLTTAKGDFQHIDLCYTLNKYTWHERLTRSAMTLWATDSERDEYQLIVHGDDTRFAYIFELHGGNKTYYFSEEGFSDTYDFDHAYYSFFQYPCTHECDLHPTLGWTRDAVVYQLFPERFCNGLGDKPYINATWDDEPKPDSFFGGDLKGITQHLDYLVSLHVNCLYLTPIFSSKSNHKYDITNYYDVDSGFGGKKAFLSLVEAGKQRGLRIILDGVFNHCSSDHPFFQDVKKRGRKSRYYDWFFIDGDRPDEKKRNYQTFASVPYMPKLNTGNPEVIDYFCRVGAWWITHFGIDGWRLDVMDETSDAFLRAFRASVKRADPTAIILGESWHDPSSYLRGDQLDGVMNYGLTKALMDYLVSESLSAEGFAQRLIRLIKRTPPAAASMMLNLIGSHDTHRFLTLLSGDKERLKIALCVLFFFPGMPCVYYGDEIGMTGGYDPLCRGGFPWNEEKWDKDIQALVRRLAKEKRLQIKDTPFAIHVCGDVVLMTRGDRRLIINASEHDAPYAFDDLSGVLPRKTYRIL